MSSCGQCLYFNNSGYTVGSSTGDCFRYPPLDGNSHRPKVQHYTTACGEFIEKNSKTMLCPTCNQVVKLEHIRFIREE